MSTATTPTAIPTAKPKNVFFETTDKAYVQALPRCIYDGRIVSIIGEGEANRAVDYLMQQPLVGIDTETRPVFRRGVSHKVALLQVAAPGICFLFRLNWIGVPPCIVRLMESPTTKKVGLSLHDDFTALRRRVPMQPQGVIELQTMAAAMGLRDMSLQKLYANVVGERISKGAQLTNWEAETLTANQQQYAATDAYACLVLYDRLTEAQREGYQIIKENRTPPTI